MPRELKTKTAQAVKAANRAAAIVAILAVAAVAPSSVPAPPAVSAPARVRAMHFTEHLIDTGLTGGYQVVVADLNHDGNPDIIALASGLHELRWYENPGWQKHVLVSGINQPINAAAWDVDGDGFPEVALAYGFSTVYDHSAGNVVILTHNADPAAPWSSKEIDRLPTSHRLRFADIDGSGKKVLVNFPLIGAHATAPDYRDRTPLVMYRPGEWKREPIADDSGVVHGILPFAWDGGMREDVLSGSFLGVYRHQFDHGTWVRTKVVGGDSSPWPKSGASEIVVGTTGRERFLATIEPWHGNQVVVYRQSGEAWKRHVIDDSIRDGHTMVTGDFDGDGQDEIIVGERAGARSVYVYRLANAAEGRWTKETLDDGGMAAASCVVADLNGDKRPDVACIGTATANLKWYENRP
ncbi:MAG: FG-GAP repeat domain-containing protein [Gemmatimonadaceae bacterium]